MGIFNWNIVYVKTAKSSFGVAWEKKEIIYNEIVDEVNENFKNYCQKKTILTLLNFLTST